ncbi:MAG: hypothetical protein P4L85_19605 [Paludisphaera borealis]|uniref:hypothetical protein n=1 Tax=Paludisphaera borealis TaxID=1387353 RepID=UPI002847093D|nr:hypothetical protein [Paludisphaera borealis]MDR3621567.1 hypothetical protein [Paludisphaera borealis]
MASKKRPLGSINGWAWAGGELSVAMCRPGNFSKFVKAFPEYANWPRVHDEVFNLLIFVNPAVQPTETPAEVEQNAWFALLDEAIEMTSPVGRG